MEGVNVVACMREKCGSVYERKGKAVVCSSMKEKEKVVYLKSFLVQRVE